MKFIFSVRGRKQSCSLVKWLGALNKAHSFSDAVNALPFFALEIVSNGSGDGPFASLLSRESARFKAINAAAMGEVQNLHLISTTNGHDKVM